MAAIDWEAALDLDRAVGNLRQEMLGDWHQDPWGWPELGYLAKKEPALVGQHCGRSGTQEAAALDVPKENWGTRPAVVLDISDRLVYQALVDRVSLDLIGNLSPNVYGWRLPAISPTAGVYSHNNKQWESYTGHLDLLGHLHEAALRTDLVSFFASIPTSPVQEAIQDHTSKGAITNRLCDLISGFQRTPYRSGLPQRSSASAVIANMYLRPLDDVLKHYAPPAQIPFTSKLTYRAFARWMDDMWLFGDDPATARRAQMDLQSAAQSIGLNLNYAKTEVLEGDDVADQARQVEHSAVDYAITKRKDFGPLEELVDRLLEDPEKASRTSIKFVTTRMREYGHRNRAKEILRSARRMPHAADALSRMFKEIFPHAGLQKWYLKYTESDWSTHEWCIANFGRMFPSSTQPGKALIEYFSSVASNANTSLPLLAVAVQRLCAWDPDEGRAACRDAYKRSTSPHARRIFALSALGAGEGRTTVKKWLGADRENYPTRRMLESYGFGPIKVQGDFAN